jgi:hypothetical protein
VLRNNVSIDPFAPDAGSGANQCGAGETLWRPDARAALTYKAGVVLNAGFTTGALTMARVEEGGLPQPGSNPPSLVVYIRALGLQAGDVQSLTLLDPAGKILAGDTAPPLPGDKATILRFIGKPRPAKGWAHGLYRANYTVKRGGAVVLQRSVDVTL